MVTHICQRTVRAVFAAGILSAIAGVAMSVNTVKFEEDEDMSMFLRRAAGANLVTSDIALPLAEMLLVHVYGKEYIEERSPLVVTDGGDRWEVRSREGIPAGERLSIVIMKRNARVFELTSF